MADEKKVVRKECGRPKKFENGFKRVCVSLPVELVEVFKECGGSNWLREQLLQTTDKKE